VGQQYEPVLLEECGRARFPEPAAREAHSAHV
jgi:hypothetical protein